MYVPVCVYVWQHCQHCTSRAPGSPPAAGWIANSAHSAVQDVTLPAFPVVHPGLTEAQAVLAGLSPHPKLKTVQPRTRKAESAAIITSSPYKQFLKDKMAASKTGSKSKHTSDIQASKTKPPGTKRIKQETKKTKKVQQETDETPCCICSRKYNEPGMWSVGVSRELWQLNSEQLRTYVWAWFTEKITEVQEINVASLACFLCILMGTSSAKQIKSGHRTVANINNRSHTC